MPGLAGRVAGGSRRAVAIRYAGLMASPVVRTRRAPWGGAGLCQRRALAASAISTLPSALCFDRRLGGVDAGCGVNSHHEHLITLPQERQPACRSVMAVQKVGLRSRLRQPHATSRTPPYQLGRGIPVGYDERSPTFEP